MGGILSVIFLPVKQTPPAGWMSDTQVLTRIPYSLVISHSSPASYHELNYREEMEPQIRAAGTSNSSAAIWSFILPRASTLCCRILSCSLWQLLSSSAGEQRFFPACFLRAFPWASGFLGQLGHFCLGKGVNPFPYPSYGRRHIGGEKRHLSGVHCLSSLLDRVWLEPCLHSTTPR